MYGKNASAIAAVALCAAGWCPPLAAQTSASRAVDVRAMEPGPESAGAPAPAGTASGLTRDARKEATLKARNAGALKPAGEAAESGRDNGAPVDAGMSARAPAATGPSLSPLPPPSAAAPAQGNNLAEGGRARTSPGRPVTKKHATPALAHGKAAHPVTGRAHPKGVPAQAHRAASAATGR